MHLWRLLPYDSRSLSRLGLKSGLCAALPERVSGVYVPKPQHVPSEQPSRLQLHAQSLATCARRRTGRLLQPQDIAAADERQKFGGALLRLLCLDSLSLLLCVQVCC